MNRIWARAPRHAMAAETPGDIPLLAACIGEKGEAQHVAQPNLCADYPPETDLLVFPLSTD